MRKIVALVSGGLFFFLIVSMYLVLEQFSQGKDEDIFKKAKLAEDSVNQLYKDVAGMANKLKDSEDALSQIENKVKRFKDEKKNSALMEVGPKDQAMCLFSETPSGTSADIKMLDVFDKLPFDNPDGGAWKQGWNVQYTQDAFDKEELLVFVIPHSHNDPGWLKTVDQYYRDQTRHILDNVIDALSDAPNRKFIWAETSYFSMWWQDVDERRKQVAKRLIKDKQLEIVTGGWVMHDEANPHYYAMVEQLIEGHQWIELNLGVKPEHGWTIDSFGHSSTMAYLLKSMGFNAMLIQRIHYAVKKYLAREKKLEFMWRQNWDHGSNTDILCHMMPFYSYDVPHTCGPDPKICCQFDFRRLPGGGMSCPWMVPPVEIEEYNVKERAYTLLDQYRKKAQLYQTNIVLAPLGDDFRYEVPFETEKQYTNYEHIMKYINNHPDLKAKIQFGTLRDYFEALWKRRNVSPGQKPPGFPVLGGDFFTYADRDDHYWSGYFTSRAFYKHLDRILESYHRAAEIIFSLGAAHSRALKTKDNYPCDKLYKRLAATRQDLAVFQHHDGITGTARDHVVIDYGIRLQRAIQSCQSIIAETAQFLLTKDKTSPDIMLRTGESQPVHDSLMSKELIILSSEPRKVVFYNSLTHLRKQTVTVYVSEPTVKVTDTTGQEIPSQVSLIWSRDQKPFNNKFELTFAVDVSPLGLKTYLLHRDKEGKNLAEIGILGTSMLPTANKNFKVSAKDSVDIVIRNKHFEAKFDPSVGTLLELMTLADRKTHKTKITFHTYGTTSGMDKSGAYLFLPDGEAKEVGMHSGTIVLTEGKIYSEVISQVQYVTHTVRIYHEDVTESRALNIKNLVDIRNAYNIELIMRMESDIKNVDGEFFTDLNGFQIQKRRTMKKIPLQANFYPLPAMAFIQDQNYRFSIHTAQPNGVASLHQGSLEVVMDRRMFQDDNRGLGQGITDNKITPSNFQILLEGITRKPSKGMDASPTAYPSMLGMHLVNRFQHPIYSVIAAAKKTNTELSGSFEGLARPLPCDLHLLTLRTLQSGIPTNPSDEAALIFHRQGYDCGFAFTCPVSNLETTFDELFSPLKTQKVVETSLSLMHEKGTVKTSRKISVPPMEMRTYKVKLS